MRASRPRILYLSCTWPHEKPSGYRLRTLQIARALKHVGEVHLVVAAETNGADTVERAASEFQVHDYIRIRGLPREEKGAGQRLKSLIDPGSREDDITILLIRRNGADAAVARDSERLTRNARLMQG